MNLKGEAKPHTGRIFDAVVAKCHVQAKLKRVTFWGEQQGFPHLTPANTYDVNRHTLSENS